MSFQAFDEIQFDEYMRSLVSPWRLKHLKKATLRTQDGLNLRYYTAAREKNRGTIVLLHGYSGFVGKYYEMLYYFWESGYQVVFLEQRGHASSDREVEDPGMIYVRDYADYVNDTHALVEEIRDMAGDGPLCLYGHSMGGLVAALYLETYPEDFDKAILSSPLLEMNYGTVPDWKVEVLAQYARVAHLEKQYAAGEGPYTGAYNFEGSGDTSRVRYDYILEQRKRNPEYQTHGSSYGWVLASRAAVRKARKNAGAVHIPVLVLQAEHDNTVKPGGQVKFAERAQNATLELIRDTKHEIYASQNPTLTAYYQMMFSFLEA